MLELAMTMAFLHESLVEALYTATKTIVTVGPNPQIDDGPDWFTVFSSVMMVAGLAFTALFTAGVVNRLINRRLVAIVGRRVAPRSNHVIVVGLGQVGLRLCLLLRELGQPVIAIESNRDADYVARVRRSAGCPSSSVAGAASSCCAGSRRTAPARSPPSPPRRSRTSRSSSRR
ncbi:MAG: hypothetical protein WKF48_01460 [Solirubrobacteraceae bacterium]